MSLVKCARAGCNERIREGLLRPSYDKTTRGGDKADGRLCWRCRDGRTAHLVKLRTLHPTIHESGCDCGNCRPWTT